MKRTSGCRNDSATVGSIGERLDPDSDWQRQREILTILAGPVAEMVYLGEPFHPAHFGPWQCRLATCMVHLRNAGAESRASHHVAGRDDGSTECHIRSDRCWAAIAALADELVAHEALEREQVSEILRFWIHSAR